MGTHLFEKRRNYEICYRPGKALRDDLSLILRVSLIYFVDCMVRRGDGRVQKSRDAHST